ncbi:MAG: twin-arginine translocase TatA/TatE family subunit [Eggerthellaceae bacterium]|jgi:sec-independent protein translocase protein TatA|nr:twin-arginine translocase TatA/TatE family subunit [Eggerthellaceae bacterium]MDR2721352.1 twin-arginine translocase TatA/TatE family subunit [Coriobacteriaceae bacterium]
MKILGMGLPELLIILAVALLIFGPKNLPKLGSALGSTVKNLREGLGDSKSTKEEVVDEIAEDEEEEKSNLLS